MFVETTFYCFNTVWANVSRLKTRVSYWKKNKCKKGIEHSKRDITNERLVKKDNIFYWSKKRRGMRKIDKFFLEEGSCRGNGNCKVAETGLFLALTGTILHTISSKDTCVLQRAPIFKKMQNFQKWLTMPSF